MKKIIILLLTITCVQTGHSQDSVSQKLDEVMRVYTKYNKFNGSVLVARGGKILLQKGYGVKNVHDKAPNGPQTIFQIGSLTKEFTAAVVLQLASEKKLSLTDPLGRYFTGFPHADSITLFHLLTHTSGIFNYTDVHDFWAQSGRPTNEQCVLDSIRSKPLLFLPGEKFSYSNSNYMLLAYIIQQVTHTPYETVVHERIFKPLGMQQSGFDFTHLVNSNKATGYWNFSAVKFMEGPVSDSSEFTGSGGMYSTVDDLYKWHRALQAGRVLGKTMQQQAYRPFKGKYAFGWETDTMYNKQTVGHGGRIFGFESRMIRVPEDDVCIILLNNTSDGPFLHAIGDKLMAILYQQPYTLPEEPLIVSENTLKAYTGTYKDEQHTFEMKVTDGHLFAILPGDKQLEFIPLKNNRFAFMEHEGDPGIFEFITDEKGTVKEMSTINPRGQKMTIKKTP